jgi:hypothetical protein
LFAQLQKSSVSSSFPNSARKLTAFVWPSSFVHPPSLSSIELHLATVARAPFDRRSRALSGCRHRAPPKLRPAAATELRPAVVAELHPSSVRSPPRAPSYRPAHAYPRGTTPLLGMVWGRGATSHQFGGGRKGYRRIGYRLRNVLEE